MNILHRFKLIYLILLLTVFSVLLSSSMFFPGRVFAFNLFGSILGDEDESDGKDEEDDEDDKSDSKDKVENKKDEKKTETRKTTVNSDGTRTVVKRKVEDNGKVEIQSKTYSIDGKVVEEQKI